MTDWITLSQFIRKHPREKLAMVLRRNGQQHRVTVHSSWRFAKAWKVVGSIGVESLPVKWPKHLLYTAQHGPLAAIGYAARKTYRLAVFNFIMVGKLILGRISLKTIGGPIAIFKTASAAWQQGLLVYLEFLAVISVMLACINILPIPALDGGHLLFLLVEAVRRRPLSTAVQLLAIRLGMLLLVVLMVQATVNDFLRF